MKKFVCAECSLFIIVVPLVELARIVRCILCGAPCDYDGDAP